MPRGKKNPEYTGKPPEAVRAFQVQRTTACRRGIPFLFTFTEWWAWWRIDARWEHRGNGLGKLMMARFNDAGAYSPENVYCATHEQNSRDISYETRSITNKAGWARGRARNSPLFSKGANNPNSRPVETPEGIFASATLAAEHFGFSRHYASYLAREERHGWRWADGATENWSEKSVQLEHPERAEDRESMPAEMEIRRERNRRRSETMKAKAAAKRAERLSDFRDPGSPADASPEQ
ncbi:hypothetical protein [Microvirga aerophila]|uniref:Uncharacterized protein n=1 Tax=Microvirga aerophila TaxID=670291 RepID=A0A512C543_9HYPH|nr:hypothetical protein [Microvirga aerophila]GEO19315.1 hypothetical protein MAE02_70110 [Microvirga aerophila]